MRGHTKRTPELVAEATRLRQGRLTWAEIAERMGVPSSTVAEWVSDPDGLKRDARKARYARRCVDCGTRTDGSHPERPKGRCRSCSETHTKATTRAWILDSFAEWAALFGAPPSASDWNPAHARAVGMTWRAERHAQTGRRWPSVTVAAEHFGSWSAALAAAGYEPKPIGGPKLDADELREVVRLYRQGLSLTEVGRHVGLSGNGVRSRLIAAGEPRRPPNPAREPATSP